MIRPMIDVRRVYEPPSPDDGLRILVDRYWPRGLRKEDAHLDQWMKDVAPSAELIKWFGHKPERWQEFKRRYWRELENNDALGELRGLAGSQKVSLLYGARDEEHNNAVALAEYLISTPLS